MFNRQKNAEADLLAALREAALRAILRKEQENGPGDINPHTDRVSTYALASMLTLSAPGEPYAPRDVVDRAAHMIYAGKPEHGEPRRDWLEWELTRLGRPDDARRLGELVRTHGGTTPR